MDATTTPQVVWCCVMAIVKITKALLSNRELPVAQQRLGDFHDCHHTAPNNLGRCRGIHQRFGLPLLGFRLQQTGP